MWEKCFQFDSTKQRRFSSSSRISNRLYAVFYFVFTVLLWVYVHTGQAEKSAWTRWN